MNFNRNAAGTADSELAAEVAAPVGDRPIAEPTLLEREAIRFAESLDDYEHVSVKEIGGEEPTSYWLAVTDERFRTTFEIGSHCDYWISSERWCIKAATTARSERRRHRRSGFGRIR